MLSIVFDDAYVRHRQQFGHPECPERLLSIKARLEAEGLFENVLKPVEATREQLEAVHDHDYLTRLKEASEGYLDPDTYIREETYSIATLAAGGAIVAADHLWEKKRPVLALLRPPGHHSGRDHCGGFCYLNNIAIAAQYLVDEKKAKKIAIVDIDVHHGNGTQNIFYERSDILFISTHLWGIYPGTGRTVEVGRGEGKGYNVNIPLNFNAGNKTYQGAMDEIILPILAKYRPEAILVSYGLDGHQADPLGGLDLTSDYLVEVVKQIHASAKEHCKGRLGLYLEGGYNLAAISEVVAGTAAYFKGTALKSALEFTEGNEECEDRDVLDRARDAQKDLWGLKKK